MIDSHVELSVQSVVHSFFFVHPSIVERLFESLGQTKDQCLKLDQVVDIKDVGIIKEPKWIETEDAGVGFGGKHFVQICPLENSLSTLIHAATSCHNFTAVILWQN